MEVLTCESYDQVLGPKFVPSWPTNFRTRDPIGNLAIKVTLTKVKQPDGSNPRSNQPAGKLADPSIPESPALSPGNAPLSPTTPLPSSPIPKSQVQPTTSVLRWQQKVFGRVQLATLRDPGIERHSYAETKMQQQVLKDDASKKSREIPLSAGAPVFSVVDGEGPINAFTGEWNAADNDAPTPLQDRMLSLSRKTDRKELANWEGFETMAIYAEIDHPVEALQGMVNNGDDDDEEFTSVRSYHQPLLFMKHSASGLVEMHPCFNDEQRIVHQFTTPYGVVYHYQIEPANILTRAQEREVARHDASQDQLLMQRRKNEVGDKFMPTPMPPHKSITILGEIVSATGFDADRDWLFVEAQLVLPSRVESKCNAAIIDSEVSTQMARPQVCAAGNGKWHFSLPFELSLTETEAGVSLPRLYLSICSIDGWEQHRLEGYSYVDVPLQGGSYELEASAWKPMGTTRESMQDFFVGGGLQMVHRRMPAQASTIKARCLSLHGFETVSTGKVQLRVSTIVQHSAEGQYVGGEMEPGSPGFGEIRRKETAQEIDEREMAALELRDRLVKRAEDRIQKYSMEAARLTANANASPRANRRRSSVRETEAASMDGAAGESTPDMTGKLDRAGKLGSSRNLSRSGRLNRSERALGSSSRLGRSSRRLQREESLKEAKEGNQTIPEEAAGEAAGEIVESNDLADVQPSGDSNSKKEQ